MNPASDTRYVLARPPCELCSTPYRFTVAGLEVQTGIGGATARLCPECAAPFLSFAPVTELVPAADAVPLLADEQAAAYLGGETWTYARTVPDDPHDYLLLRVSRDPWTHLRAIRFIRHYGVRRQWRLRGTGRPQWFSYWNAGAFDYWAMPNENETVLNRRAAQ